MADLEEFIWLIIIITHVFRYLLNAQYALENENTICPLHTLKVYPIADCHIITYIGVLCTVKVHVVNLADLAD